MMNIQYPSRNDEFPSFLNIGYSISFIIGYSLLNIGYSIPFIIGYSLLNIGYSIPFIIGYSLLNIGYSNMDPIELPIDGILDLHYFNPKEVKDLIPDYIEACLEKDIRSLRIIHGKGKGVLRRTVHSLLDKNPHVKSYRLANDQSSWGATLVELEGEK